MTPLRNRTRRAVAVAGVAVFALIVSGAYIAGPAAAASNHPNKKVATTTTSDKDKKDKTKTDPSSPTALPTITSTAPVAVPTDPSSSAAPKPPAGHKPKDPGKKGGTQGKGTGSKKSPSDTPPPLVLNSVSVVRANDGTDPKALDFTFNGSDYVVGRPYILADPINGVNTASFVATQGTEQNSGSFSEPSGTCAAYTIKVNLQPADNSDQEGSTPLTDVNVPACTVQPTTVVFDTITTANSKTAFTITVQGPGSVQVGGASYQCSVTLTCSDLDSQVLFNNVATASYTAGVHALPLVNDPLCGPVQVDLYYGPVITHLSSTVRYGDNLIDHAFLNDTSGQCTTTPPTTPVTTPVTTPPTTPVTTPPTTASTTPPATTPASTPATTASTTPPPTTPANTPPSSPKSSGGSTGSLPFTGSNTIGELAVGGGLIAVGGGLIAGASRRGRSLRGRLRKFISGGMHH